MRRRRTAGAGRAIKACPRCGCPTLQPGRAWEGPVVYLHEPLGSHGCPACGLRGVPLEFDDVADWKAFALEGLAHYWATLPRDDRPSGTGPPRGRARRGWRVCADCLSPWVLGKGEDAPDGLCRVCGGERPLRDFATREAWAVELRERLAGAR